MPQANSTTSRPRVTSPRASDTTLPCSLEMSAASFSRSRSISSLNLKITRARRRGGVAAQAGNAACAAAIALPTSSALAKATRPLTAPSAGLYTSPKRPLAPATSLPSIQ